ncbi:hypothetical protein H6802_01595 [Candidatus Nomurabacteria bacterium]|uniref:Uncharacterized protein n=1 Tax=candidate division WWE3 bacterium TaxID=2053526 RepID=A0A955E0E5_UNCKA|nr:hypothetical protein [candidate division WWE3 bacterium]MCB9823628.1 hypothetical protein [Candidatus Nomurabacteria bacterium]MCB9827294.1 hypothetical protein [Candidatus Nomurabacteria bacterium]MCB9827423.1 hypothetical protein [Candidatus Nomurabacteria bacterium]HXK52755.1 hypothetical protein [bacterium]
MPIYTLIQNNNIWILFVFEIIILCLFFSIIYKAIKFLLVRAELFGSSDLEKSLSYDKASKIIEYAQRRAIKILARASIDAEKKLRGATKVNKDLQEELFQNLNRVYVSHIKEFEGLSESLLLNYKAVLQRESAVGAQVLEEMGASVEEMVKAEGKEFRKNLESRTLLAEEKLSNEIDEEYKKVKKEIELYKESRLKEVEEKVNALLYSIISQYISKDISVTIHEELVKAHFDRLVQELQLKKKV